MSIHSSLHGVDTLTGDRSVLKRIERLQKLMHDGKMTPEDSPYGLPKVRTAYKVKGAKKKKLAEGEESGEAAAAEAASEGGGEGESAPPES